MGDAVKKTISLPPDLAEDAERIAKEDGNSLSAVIQDALRLSRRQRQLKNGPLWQSKIPPLSWLSLSVRVAGRCRP